jgi:hypothetical protein
MSEKIYAWLLRLYPSHFREAYSDEALQLFRDRARDEKGLVPGLRLWLDVLIDLVISVPREYRRVRPKLASVWVPAHLNRVPSFHVLEGEAIRPAALFFGGVLSLATLSGLPFLIGHFGNLRAPRAPFLEPQRAAYGHSSTAEGLQLDAAERQRVIDAAIANLKQHYIDPDVAQKVADVLLAHQKSGDYDAQTEGGAFADLLTSQMREVSQDMHLVMVYSQKPLPDRPAGPSPEGFARYRKAMEQENCTFERVQILPHNIGYLKLNSFPDPSVCQPTAMAAMASLSRADAIIFDLRDNRGGFPKMVMLIAAYLFDHPEYMYNPRDNTTQESWTRSPVAGSRLADKPVYVLTSARTLSGAEQFSYDLKMLKRALLVGEKTGGSAHSGAFHRIDDHFGMGIPETREINPFSKADWEGTGVQPDVMVKAADALETAERLAETRLRKR